MNNVGLARGDEYYVSVRINKQLIADFVGLTISITETSCELYLDPDANEIAVFEALKAATSTMDWHVQRPRLKQLLQERIALLKKESEEEGEDNPPPPSTDLLPFE